MEEIAVSIVIVNYNGREIIKVVLDSIFKLNFNGYEIIIVDNASIDDDVEFIKKNYEKVRIVQNKANMGYVGINSAIDCCNGEYILFLNNDIELDKNCLNELMKIAKLENVGLVVPKLVNFYDKKITSGGTWVSRAFYNGHVKSDKGESIKEVPYLGVGLIKKQYVDMFGYLFDPDYFIYSEDLDLGLRLRLLGLKTIFVPKAIMYHMHSATMQNTNNYKKTFLLERNLLTTFLKILSIKNIFFFLPYVLGVRVFAILKDIVNLSFLNAFSRVRAILWILLNMKLIYKKRLGLQRARKVSDDFLLKVFSEKYLLAKQFIV